MRDPKTISAEARHLVDTSNKAFVPAPIVRLAELSVEFMESCAALLESQGFMDPAPTPAAVLPAVDNPAAGV